MESNLKNKKPGLLYSVTLLFSNCIENLWYLFVKLSQIKSKGNSLIKKKKRCGLNKKRKSKRKKKEKNNERKKGLKERKERKK